MILGRSIDLSLILLATPAFFMRRSESYHCSRLSETSTPGYSLSISSLDKDLPTDGAMSVDVGGIFRCRFITRIVPRFPLPALEASARLGECGVSSV